MAQTSGDQTKDENQHAHGPKDAPSQANSAATATNTSSTTSTAAVQEPDQDKDFDPTAEALIDEIDDERTLEEEEALAGADSAAVQNEIDELKRESEMPIEELLAYYERMRNEEAAAAGGANQEEEDEEFEEENDEEDEDDDDDDDDDGEESDEVRKRRADKTVSDTYDRRTDQRLAATTTTATTAAAAARHPAAGQPIDRSSNQQMQSAQLQGQVHLPNSHRLTSSSPQLNRSLDVSLSNNHSHSQQQQQLAQQSDVANSGGRVQPVHDQDSASKRDSNANITPGSNSNSRHDEHHTCDPSLNSSYHRHHGLNYAHQNQNHRHHNHHHHNQQLIDPADVDHVGAQRTHRHSMTEFLVDSDTAASGIFKTLLDYDLDDSDDLDEDYSYTDDENAEDDEREWRRVIHVGPEHQADIPEGLCEYEDDLPPYENQDILVWRCNPEQESKPLLEYLKQASMLGKRTDISLSPASVPKISDHNLRLYRERLQDGSGPVTLSLQPTEQNHENINTSENPPENLHDVYMSQSRKRLRIDSELEQENAVDGLTQTPGDMPIVGSMGFLAKDDNSNSVSQDTRPELSTEDYFQGEEQLLYLLLQCNHNFEEALRRRRLDPFKYYISEPMSLWSQEECLGFEHGLRTYGKNFRLIRNQEVPTRTRAEVVAFYYLWKKSERHDVYTNQYKLDRKRCLSHPGTTDYMDKFIEDNESALNASSTPTPTPTDCTAEVHQISHMTNASGNPSISACNTSELTAMPANCPQELSLIRGLCHTADGRSTAGDDNTSQCKTFYLDSNAPI